MKDFWKNTRKIAWTLVEWACYLGFVVCAGALAHVVWLALRFGWEVVK